MGSKTGRSASPVREIACPQCGAGPNERCLNRYKTGRIMAYHHARKAAYDELLEAGNTTSTLLCPKPKVTCWMGCRSVSIEGCQFCNFCNDPNCEHLHPGALRQ